MDTAPHATRFASLDGMRAISILLVVTAHVVGAVPVFWRLDCGNLGVRTFFLISGFLITALLINEHRKTGSISLRDFYVRRFLRIFPAYWAFVATMAILLGYGLVTAKWSEFLPTLAYYSNYRHPDGVFGHTWSLSVEEQFYLLWPALVVALGLRKAYVGCIVMLVMAPVFRVAADLGYWPTESRYAWECVCDALATGCALALLREPLWSLPWYRRLVRSPAALIAPACALLLLAAQSPILPRGLIVKDVIALPALNVTLAILLDRYMRFPELRFGRVLNSGPLVWLGTLSYSIYLWQQPFVYRGRLPLYLALPAVLACAAASYYLVERPFNGLRARFRTHKAQAAPVGAAGPVPESAVTRGSPG